MNECIRGTFPSHWPLSQHWMNLKVLDMEPELCRTCLLFPSSVLDQILLFGDGNCVHEQLVQRHRAMSAQQAQHASSTWIRDEAHYRQDHCVSQE